MPLLLPLLEWLAPLIALAICALAAAFAKPIVNSVSTGWGLANRVLNFLVNKALDLAIDLTKFMAPVFIQDASRIANFFHQLGQLAHYSAHFAWRSATTFANFNHWLLKAYLPAQFRAVTGHVTTVTLTKISKVALSKAQFTTLEHQLESYLRRTIGATIPGVVPKAWPKINWTPKHWREWLGLAAGGGALALPGSLAWEKELNKELHKGLTTVGKRLKRVEKVLGAAGAATVVTYGLAKLGLGWMARCRNLKHIGPAFCGANLSALLGLFGALAVIEGKFSIVEMAEGMLAVEEDMVKIIGGAFSELDGIA